MGKSVVGRKGVVGHLESMKLEIELPIEDAPTVRSHVLEELACVLFKQGLLRFGQARKLAGLGFIEFQKALGDRQIPRFTLEMFEQELKHAGHQ